MTKSNKVVNINEFKNVGIKIYLEITDFLITT